MQTFVVADEPNRATRFGVFCGGEKVTGDPTLQVLRTADSAVVSGADTKGKDASHALSQYVVDTTLPAAQNTAATQPQDKTSVGEVAGTFVRSLVYSAIQTPLDGSTQLLNGMVRPFVGRQVIPRVELLEAPGPVEFGSPEWTARLAGGGIGTILPFWAGGKVAVRAVSGLRDVKYLGPAIERLGILEQNSAAQLAFKGAVYEGIFHPVDEQSGSFWGQRAVNFGAGGLSFLALGKANEAMRNSKFGKWALASSIPAVPLTSELMIDAASGATAGITDTTIHSLANWELPKAGNLAQSAGEYAIMSMFLRMGRLPIEKVTKEKAPVVEEQKPEPGPELDKGSLRPTLPFDKGTFKKTVMANGQEAEHIGVQKGTGRNLFYREMPEPGPEAPRIRISAEELHNGEYQRVQHRGQDFAVNSEGKAYSVREIDGVYELVLTDKVILERLNEVQVPWPPMQSQDQYNTRQVIRLDEMFHNWAMSH